MPSLQVDVERARAGPEVVILPNTPPMAVATQAHDYAPDTDLLTDHGDHNNDGLHVPSSAVHERHQDRKPIDPNTQSQILTALSVGAPLIASVVSSCTSVIAADFTSALGPDPKQRSAHASAVVALLWCALITSLGATMTAVAGLAMHAGYHDSHVGVTKRIVRFLRSRWKRETPRGPAALPHHEATGKRTRTPSPYPPQSMLSAITDTHKEMHAFASFRAAVVSARLLGASVGLLAMAMAVYLFLIYPLPVALSTLLVGVVTAGAAALPMLPILTQRS